METPVINLKPTTVQEILSFVHGQQPERMQGSRLKALYSLIQSKGEPISADNKRLNGQKALKIKDNLWIALVRTSSVQNSEQFYPCRLDSFLLESLVD